MTTHFKLIYGLVFVATNAVAVSTVTVCNTNNECKAVDNLESLEVLPSSEGAGGAVKIFSDSLYLKVNSPVIPPPVDPNVCPAPLLAQEEINYPIGSNTQFPSMEKGEALVIELVPPANHTGKISWGPAVSTNQTTSKIGVISTCPGVINSNIANETIYPCRRSSNQDSLWYSTEANSEFDKCKLEAGKTYYVNIFSGNDANVVNNNYDSFNACPTGKRCDISLNVK